MGALQWAYIFTGFPNREVEVEGKLFSFLTNYNIHFKKNAGPCNHKIDLFELAQTIITLTLIGEEKALEAAANRAAKRAAFDQALIIMRERHNTGRFRKDELSSFTKFDSVDDFFNSI
jgi:hypothetical protein